MRTAAQLHVLAQSPSAMKIATPVKYGIGIEMELKSPSFGLLPFPAFPSIRPFSLPLFSLLLFPILQPPFFPPRSLLSSRFSFSVLSQPSEWPTFLVQL